MVSLIPFPVPKTYELSVYISVDLSALRLTGQSVAPVQGKHEHANPRRTDEAQAKTLDKKGFNEQRVFVKKERQGFGGGFKILEEYRRKKLARKSSKKHDEDEDEHEKHTENQVTKDEIF